MERLIDRIKSAGWEVMDDGVFLTLKMGKFMFSVERNRAALEIIEEAYDYDEEDAIKGYLNELAEAVRGF